MNLPTKAGKSIEQVARSTVAGVVRRSIRTMELSLAELIRSALSAPIVAEDQMRDFNRALVSVMQREDAGHLVVGDHALALLGSVAYRALREEHTKAVAQLGVPSITSEALLHARIYLAGRFEGRKHERANWKGKKPKAAGGAGHSIKGVAA